MLLLINLPAVTFIYAQDQWNSLIDFFLVTTGLCFGEVTNSFDNVIIFVIPIF